MIASVHIATHQGSAFKGDYLIAKLKCHWELAGHQITCGPIQKLEADLGILHVDLTRVAPEMIPENPSQCRFLNEHVLDISKSCFSSLRVLPGDCWDGPVIVKSDLNSYGGHEWKQKQPGILQRKRRKLAKNFWRLARMLPPKRYPVLARLSDVPGWVWEHPDIIVERFMPERDGDLFCLRGWVFFGTRSYTYRLFATDSQVKVGTMVRHEFLDNPPPELEAFREVHKFDFGKFDYVEVDGRPILLDINKTPSVVSDPFTPRLKHLADGLDEMLRAP
jgi:hypothetical protein